METSDLIWLMLNPCVNSIRMSAVAALIAQMLWARRFRSYLLARPSPRRIAANSHYLKARLFFTTT